MYRKDSPQTIQSMFNSIAKRYDINNALLSFSLHKRWNRTLVQHACQKNSSKVLIDLCSGTGDIAFDYLRRTPHPCQAYLIDFSSEMLEQAKLKAHKENLNASHQLSYLEADVQHIPLPDQMADHATMAYGIRNVQDPAECIKEVFRILKSGGSFGILELTRPHSRILRMGHFLYLNAYLPFFGKAYRYLSKSIQTFTAPEEIENLLIANGFVHTQCYPLMGGIATIVMGHKK